MQLDRRTAAQLVFNVLKFFFFLLHVVFVFVKRGDFICYFHFESDGQERLILSFCCEVRPFAVTQKFKFQIRLHCGNCRL